MEVISEQCAADAAGNLARIDDVARHQYGLKSEQPTSPTAVESAKKLLKDAAAFCAVPRASILPFKGGLQLYWNNGDKYLMLYCSPDKQAYINRLRQTAARECSEALSTKDVNARVLADQLSWLACSGTPKPSLWRKVKELLAFPFCQEPNCLSEGSKTPRIVRDADTSK